MGDLGPQAYKFADLLVSAGQSIWQVLPLGPAGYGNSPYQCFSSMAGNPLLISLETLAREGWLERVDLENIEPSSDVSVDFGRVIPLKWKLLRKAATAFVRAQGGGQRVEFESFCSENRTWLDGFVAFMALKDANLGASWVEWRERGEPDPRLLQAHRFIQFEFFRQWRALKQYCNQRGILFFGDIPIFVAHDSADVYGNAALFDLDSRGYPATIAGVPPDYFSSNGQCWGNPLYRWEVHAETGYEWWIQRVRGTLALVDYVRLDHFRGFEKYYAIPGGATTAIHGEWREGPGSKLFEALQNALGNLPFLAEDLGFITPEVEALRDIWGFPGMRVLQFAFGSEAADDPFKPHNYVRNSVVYTGTHDNDTSVGWFNARGTGNTTRAPEEVRREREFALRYLGSDGREIHWDFIRAVLASVADTAIIPFQDILGLGSEARMNLPGSPENNWTWRFAERQVDVASFERLRSWTLMYGRSSQKA